MKKIYFILLTTLLIFFVITPNIHALFLPININGVSSESSNGLVSHGNGDPRYWPIFYGNAQEYFKIWCDTIQSGAFDNESISYIIKTYNVSYFYVIAHSNGSSKQFQIKENVFYTTDQLREDMKNRPPIKLAFIFCCDGMTETGPGSLSYEFRKGQIKDTATIGYANMKEFSKNNGTMWYALNWQNALFNYINRGYTVKKAFDTASNIYPEIAEYVKFVGDENLRVKNPVFNPTKTSFKTFNQLPLISYMLKKIIINKKI